MFQDTGVINLGPYYELCTIENDLSKQAVYGFIKERSTML